MKANLAAREPEMLRDVGGDPTLPSRSRSRERVAELFVLHDGPPFANGDVHMGTALNKILKDFVVKSQTMLGKRAPYVPGWDCHGLPIEYKVVKESRGLSPLEVRKRSEAFARKFVDIQREQFKRLGVFGDWENPYLTMDPKYEAEILRAFAVFVEEGLVYQSKKPVFWSTGAQTALAEAEVEYQDRDDTAVYVRFPVLPDQVAKIGLQLTNQSASRSGQPRHGHCRQISRSQWIRTTEYEILSNQDERADRCSQVFANSLFSKLVLLPRKNLDLSVANSWSGFRRNIHFSTENPPYSPPISSPWIPAQAWCTSRPVTARTITG